MSKSSESSVAVVGMAQDDQWAWEACMCCGETTAPEQMEEGTCGKCRSATDAAWEAAGSPMVVVPPTAEVSADAAVLALQQAMRQVRLALTNPALPADAASLAAADGHELALRRWAESLAGQPSSEQPVVQTARCSPAEHYPGQAAYDVLQVWSDNAKAWHDFCTLRDDQDFRTARRMVDNGGGMNGFPAAEHRITDGKGGVKYQRAGSDAKVVADLMSMPRAMLEGLCQERGIRYPLGASRAKLASLLSAKAMA